MQTPRVLASLVLIVLAGPSVACGGLDGEWEGTSVEGAPDVGVLLPTSLLGTWQIVKLGRGVASGEASFEEICTLNALGETKAILRGSGMASAAEDHASVQCTDFSGESNLSFGRSTAAGDLICSRVRADASQEGMSCPVQTLEDEEGRALPGGSVELRRASVEPLIDVWSPVLVIEDSELYLEFGAMELDGGVEPLTYAGDADAFRDSLSVILDPPGGLPSIDLICERRSGELVCGLEGSTVTFTR